jgi:hypothetical protein
MAPVLVLLVVGYVVHDEKIVYELLIGKYVGGNTSDLFEGVVASFSWISGEYHSISD